MHLSSTEQNMLTDMAQDSHELWDVYAFVRHNEPNLPERVALDAGIIDGGAAAGRETIYSQNKGKWNTHCEEVYLYELGAGSGIPFLGGIHLGVGLYNQYSGELGVFFFASGKLFGVNSFLGIGGSTENSASKQCNNIRCL